MDKINEYIECAKNPIYYLNNYGFVFNAKKQTVTKMECFPYQERCLKRFHKFKENIILKSRQCLPENTYVDTPIGPKAIQDFKSGDEVYSYNFKTNSVELDKVYDSWYSGKKQCIKFKLQDNRYFEVGENHPFFVKEKGWVKAKNLKKGDEILDCELEFGNIPASENEVKKQVTKKILHKEVFYWNKESISLLINIIFAKNGWINVLRKKNNKKLEIGISCTNEEFLNQIKFLLKKFNINSNIFKIKNRPFKLRISHSKSIIKFINEIGILDKINQEHYEIYKNYKYDVKESSIIKKIEKTKVKKCYDISVEKNENFLVNGLLTHNTGLSVVTAGYVAWRLLFRENEKILIIANDGAGARRFLATVKQFIENTPLWLFPKNPETLEKALKVDNQTKIQLLNKSWAEAKASSPQAGRGESLTLLVLDEAAFIEHADSIWMGAKIALSATGGKCIMISTPNGTSNLYYKTWVDAEKKENGFKTTRVHWTENPFTSQGLEERLDEEGNIVYWSPWYEERCREFQWDMVKISQELDLSFEGSERLAVDNNIIHKYEKRVEKSKPVCYLEFFPESSDDTCLKIQEKETVFHVFKLPEEGVGYILSADVSRGDGKDYSTIQILDAKTAEQVAEFQGKIETDLFAKLINSVGRFYNEAYAAVEANSLGLGVTLDLQKKYKYKNLHYVKNIKDIFIPVYDYSIGEGVQIPGFQTTPRSRPLMMAILKKYMRMSEVTLHSKRLVSEFRTFILKTTKTQVREEAKEGYNDDLIMSLAIALYIRDTELEKVAFSKSTYKSMIEAISMRSNAAQNSENLNKGSQDKVNNMFGVFSSNSPAPGGVGTNIDDDDDDLSWLLK